LTRHHWFFHFVQIAGIGIGVYWWRHVPVPGYAIGIVAVLAAAMSLQGEMPGVQKALWMLLIGLFLAIEYRSIDQDHKSYEDEFHATLDKFIEIKTAIDEDRATRENEFSVIQSEYQGIKKAADVLGNRLTGEISSVRSLIPSAPSLKERALEMAKRITDSVNSRGQDFPKRTETLDGIEYSQALRKYYDSVNTDWKSRFLNQVTDITDELQAQRVMPAGKTLCQSESRSDPLVFQLYCARRTEEAAEKLE
jgi:hypothetical protein